jgi:hypothetical protein
MNKTPQEEYLEKVELIKFFGAVKGSLNEINTKVVEGSNLRSDLDIKKLALDHDKATGTPQAAPVEPQSHLQLLHADSNNNFLQPPIAIDTISHDDPNQLTLPFDKKYNLNDIFAKVDDMYRKVILLENQVYKLQQLVENKKKEL